MIAARVMWVRIRNAFIESCLARGAVTAAHCLFATVRKDLRMAEQSISPYQPPGETTYIYSVWHDSLMMPLFLGRQPATMALVGMHQDGAFLATSLKALGIPTVRGSSSRGGAQAVRQLLKETQNHHIVVTPDGPRGPRRQMKSGIAYMSSRTGKPVVPTAFVCRRAWSIGTGWTDLAIPKPWTKIVAIGGPSILVPPDANRDQIDHYTQQIQTAMNEVNQEASRLAGIRTTPEMFPTLDSASQTVTANPDQQLVPSPQGPIPN